MIGVERLFIYLLAFAIVNHETVPSLRAAMAELVDALASGASVRKYVEVQVLFAAPKNRYVKKHPHRVFFTIKNTPARLKYFSM